MFIFVPSLKNASGGMRHAINAPVGIPMFVTDRDGESSIIGSDDLNGFT